MINRLLGKRTEDRSSYTDLITQAILLQATAEEALSGALEIAAGYVSRAFASATPHGRDAYLFDAVVLSEIGRELIELGETAWRIGDGELVQLAGYQILDTGVYQASGQPIPQSSVLHIRYNTDIHTMRGISPLNRAGGLNTLLTRIEQAMGYEAGSTVGYLVSIPSGGQAAATAQLKADIARMKGEIALVETTSGGWDAGRGNAPRRDYLPQRLGADIPETSVQIYQYAVQLALVACGVPPELADSRTDGTGQRESWRRFLFGTLVPLSKLVTAFAARRGLEVTLDFEDLMASDIAGRARAFGSLVQGGMDIEEAAILTGLVTVEE